MAFSINKLTICILIAAAAVLLCSCSYGSMPVHVPDPDVMEVDYINAGQGDSILIQVNNKNILIDAGPEINVNGTEVFLKSHSVKILDYCIATHPHEDHIGGMARILKDFRTEAFYAPEIAADTKCFKDMVKVLKNKNFHINIARAGIKLDFGKNACAEFIAPNSHSYNDLNDYSAVLKVTYGNANFLFQGDAQFLSEKEILKEGYDVSSDVLKVGHHGSKTSTSQEFLSKVSPKIAIISCGQGNDYGHPHKITLDKLQKAGCKIYSTYIDGNITLISDGKNIFKK